MEGNREKYYLRISNKLMDPTTSAKTYYSILKTLINKEIPCIPPLFHQGKNVTDFKRKAELFNSIIQNSSKFPLTLSKKTKSLFQVLLSTVMKLQQLFVALILTKFMN